MIGAGFVGPPLGKSHSYTPLMRTIETPTLGLVTVIN